MRLFRGLAPLAPLFAVLALAAPARAAPAFPLGHAGRWITDGSGRVVVVHGINMVYKVPPYYPAAAGFGDDDATFLHSIGFNAVRVGVIWKAVEPQPGAYNDSYLAQIADTVKLLARHGIVSLLDFHQDMLTEQFQGEGFPDWAIQTGGLLNPTLGFPGNYLGNPALGHALDQFYANAPGPGGIGLQDRLAAAWAHVAAYFRKQPSVLGYELLNEPFPGTVWEPCALPGGCPAFDAKLGSLYRRLATAIRTQDQRTLIWYEPNPLFNFGPATAVPGLGDPHAGFSFHDYCLGASPQGCSTEATPFANALTHVAATREAVMMTEFGATNLVGDLDGMVARADANMVPWLEWAYCGCHDPTTTGPGNEQAIVIDPSKPPTGANLVEPTLNALVEPYPQVVAGTPTSWSYNRSANTFKLAFSPSRASADGSFATGSVSEIATPALDYRSGYAASAAGAAIVSSPAAATLLLAQCRGAAQVSVTVAPSGRSGGSCRARLQIALAPRRYVAGRTTTFRLTVTAVLGAYRAPVPGATAVIAGRRVRTGQRGSARFRLRLRGGRHIVVARAPGFISGRARLTAN
ncbi:MAG TPA: cellulase family glycosylhydrolase [Solirubrobacteraceae bacterium]|jgi:endoglycosylceramidase|nr:cellulase family glycosylhydrolase [Solirubrobacteraceae bacterium]